MGKKNKKRIEFIWSIISILVVVSMVLLYMPSVFQ
jgi:predicted nucleic acid-binding Zn ribbon protein